MAMRSPTSETRVDQQSPRLTALALRTRPLPFEQRPTIGRVSISSPAVMRPLATLNEGKPYGQQLKPFNFMLTCHRPKRPSHRSLRISTLVRQTVPRRYYKSSHYASCSFSRRQPS